MQNINSDYAIILLLIRCTKTNHIIQNYSIYFTLISSYFAKKAQRLKTPLGVKRIIIIMVIIKIIMMHVI